MPLWLTKIWNALKIAALWTKHNWVLLLLGIVIVYAMIFAKRKAENYDALMKEFRSKQEQSKKELDQLRQIQNDQMARQQEIDRQYREVVDRIERDYRTSLAQLDNQKRTEIRTIVTQNHDDPTAMAQQINSLLGISIYQTSPIPPT